MRAVEVDRDDGRLGLALDAVILADREEPPTPGIEAQVGVVGRALGGDGDRRLVAGVEPVQPAIVEVREDDGPAGHDVGAAAVFVDVRPDVERGRRQVDGRAVARRPDQHAAAAPRLAGLRSSRRRRHRAMARPAGRRPR